MNKKKILVVFLLVSFIGLGVLWGVVGFDGLKLISADKQKETGAPKEEYSQILCSCQFKEQVDPLDHYPLKKGNKWIYSNVYKHAVGKDQHIVTVTWDKEIEV
ncbi:MAG: hypothetical protein GY869_09965, partial [Planctomycetes bacterium]|nr:hypothetical protein [Planctomycetota bacterium]